MGGRDVGDRGRADFYRQAARSLRTRAATLRTAEARDELLSLGADYARLADYVQSSLAHRLPANREGPRAKPFRVAEESTPSTPARPRILIVEDEAVLCSHLARALSDQYVVDAAVTGTEALSAVRLNKPDLIITDVVMPGMDGVEFLRTIRSVSSTRGIPVLLTSGRAPETQRIEGFTEGADGYLSKPYTERELRAIVASMLHSAQLRAELARREEREHSDRRALAERATLLESITDAFYALDEEWRFTYLNQRALNFYGKTSEELLGRSIWEMLPRVSGSTLEERFRSACRDQRADSFETPSPLTGRWIDVRIYPTGKGLAVYFRDISARKRAERELQLALGRLRRREWLLDLATNFAGMGVFTWSVRNDHLTLENARALEILGDLKERSATGRKFIKRSIHPENRAKLRREVLLSVRSAAPLRCSCRILLGDGTSRWIEIAGGVEARDDGEPERLVGVFSDSTERKRAEESLRDSDRRKDEFLALLGHELRNPLAPIQNGLQMLRLRAPNDAVFTRTLVMMDRQLAHLVRLVDDLLDVGRITWGKLQLRTQKVRLADVLASAVEASRSLIEAHGHLLSVNLRAPALMVEGDADRLMQVFANLLLNSARYTERGGRIELTLDREGDEAVIVVKDNGIGIPREELERIFHLFSQVRAQGVRIQAGLGIGLALARTLLELHQGAISAASDGPGTGSTFTVRLPLADHASDTGTESAGEDAKAAFTAGCHRILVVDDNADAVATLSDLLEMNGYEVRTAADGEEAIARAQDFRPDIIFMDLGMPRMDGMEATRRIRAMPELSGIKIVAVTGWGQALDRIRGREAGMDEHLIKPVAPESLQSVLQSIGSH